MFPGALGAERFYLQCRETGVKITMEEAEFMRNAWISTFKEMKKHMQPARAIFVPRIGKVYAAVDTEEEVEEDRGRDYSCTLPCGQVRNRCSFNAACNTAFQATVALGAKQAGWNLVYNGYGPRLWNFVHHMVHAKESELLEAAAGDAGGNQPPSAGCDSQPTL